MKIYTIFATLILLTVSLSAFSQEKIKGNKQVTTENRSISEFTKIEVIDNIDVELVYNESQSVEVETDSNLQNAVKTEVNEGVLSIKLSTRIVRKKSLKIHIMVNKSLEEIAAYNNANVSSKNLLIIDSLTLNAFDNADFNLKLNSKVLRILGKKTSNLNLEALSDETFIRTEESSRIKGAVDTKSMAATILDRSVVVIRGTADSFTLESNGNSSFKGKEFVAKNSVVGTSNSSDVFVNCTETIEILAKNTSEIYLYSNPKITITEFFDKASIHKKEVDKGLF